MGGGDDVVRDFMSALRSHPTALNVLLKDSDAPDDGCLLASLKQRSDWKLPAGMTVSQDQVFWMVQIMEAWFLADRDVLKKFYGGDFHENSLPANPRIEEVPKGDVLSGLKQATSQTTAGRYHKTRHAVKLLSLLSAETVAAVAPNCRRLFETLKNEGCD